MIMKNVRQKLADACKNVEMSRELNEFTSYMATVVMMNLILKACF